MATTLPRCWPFEDISNALPRIHNIFVYQGVRLAALDCLLHGPLMWNKRMQIIKSLDID
jgi:hypothetical protein